MLSRIAIKATPDAVVDRVAHWTYSSSKHFASYDEFPRTVDVITRGFYPSSAFFYDELKQCKFAVSIHTKDCWIFILQNLDTRHFVAVYERAGIKSFRIYPCNITLRKLVYSVKFGVFFGTDGDRLHLFNDIICEMSRIVSYEIPDASSCLLFDDDLRRLFSGSTGRVITWRFDAKWSPAESGLPTPTSLYLPSNRASDDLVPRRMKSDSKYNQLMVLTNSSLVIFSLMTWTPSLIVPQDALSAVVMHDLSQVLLCASGDGEVSLIDTDGMINFFNSSLHQSRVIDAEAIGSGPVYAVTGSIDGTILSWNLSFREEGIFGFNLFEDYDEANAPSQSPNKNHQALLQMSLLEEDSIFCKTTMGLSIFKLEPFGYTFTSFPSNIARIFSSNVTFDPNKRNCLEVYTADGLWFAIDSINGSPKATVAIGDDADVRSVFSSDGYFDVNGNQFFMRTSSGVVAEYDCTESPGKITPGGVFKAPRHLGRIRAICSIIVREELLCEQHDTNFDEDEEDEQFIIAGHSTGKISLLAARKAYHFVVENGPSTDAAKSEGQEIVTLASPSDGSTPLLFASVNGKRTVSVWSLSGNRTTEAAFSHLDTIVARKRYEYQLGNGFFQSGQSPSLFIAYNRLWCFLREISPQSPPTECRLDVQSSGFIRPEGNPALDAILKDVNLVVPARIFVTVDSASIFRIWQLEDLSNSDKTSSHEVYLTREIRLSGLAADIQGFCFVAGFCYFATGKVIVVVEPDEMFLPQQLERMARYLPKAQKKHVSMRLANKNSIKDPADMEVEKPKVLDLLPESYDFYTRNNLSKIVGDPYGLIDRMLLRLRRALHCAIFVILYELAIDKAQLVIYTNNPSFEQGKAGIRPAGEVGSFAKQLKLNIEFVMLSTIVARKSAGERAQLYALGREIYRADSAEAARDAANLPFDTTYVYHHLKLDTKSSHPAPVNELLKVLAKQYSLSMSSPEEAASSLVTESEKALIRVLSRTRWPIAPDGQIPNSIVRQGYGSPVPGADGKIGQNVIRRNGDQPSEQAAGQKKKTRVRFHERRSSWLATGLSVWKEKDDHETDVTDNDDEKTDDEQNEKITEYDEDFKLTPEMPKYKILFGYQPDLKARQEQTKALLAQQEKSLRSLNLSHAFPPKSAQNQQQQQKKNSSKEQTANSTDNNNNTNNNASNNSNSNSKALLSPSASPLLRRPSPTAPRVPPGSASSYQTRSAPNSASIRAASSSAPIPVPRLDLSKKASEDRVSLAAKHPIPEKQESKPNKMKNPFLNLRSEIAGSVSTRMSTLTTSTLMRQRSAHVTTIKIRSQSSSVTALNNVGLRSGGSRKSTERDGRTMEPPDEPTGNNDGAPEAGEIDDFTGDNPPKGNLEVNESNTLTAFRDFLSSKARAVSGVNRRGLLPESPLMYAYYDRSEAHSSYSRSRPTTVPNNSRTLTSQLSEKVSPNKDAIEAKNNNNDELGTRMPSPDPYDKHLNVANFISKISLDASCFDEAINFDEEIENAAKKGGFDHLKFWPPRTGTYIGNPFIGCYRWPNHRLRNYKLSTSASLAANLSPRSKDAKWVTFTSSLGNTSTPSDSGGSTGLRRCPTNSPRAVSPGSRTPMIEQAALPRVRYEWKKPMK